MYPDIVMITDANVGISTTTLKSIAKYAPHCNCIIKPNLGIDRQRKKYIQTERLLALAGATSEYVLIMDDDDEIVSPVPKNSGIKNDVVFFNYTQDGLAKRDFRRCLPSQVCVFCGVLLKRDIAVRALHYTIENQFLREDIGFFYFLNINVEDVFYSDSVLINKIGQREPKKNSWLRDHFRKELEIVWRKKINHIRGNNL